ncbi:MAG: hypothetical protein KDE27_18120, partial [Planctomycetes bacterium]|nr:hypothetical protein [Planctomycetota bacterium]
ETDPEPPSLRATAGATAAARATARGTTPVVLRRRLRGELDWITLCALSKEPHRRYATIREFRGDLERHLGGLAVEAAPPSRWYKVQKTFRRHRIAVLVGLAILLTGLVGGTSTLLALARAETHAAEATALYGTAIAAVDELFYQNAQVRLRGLPNASALMFRFYGDCRTFYRRLAALRPLDPELRFKLAQTDLAVGGERIAMGGDAAAGEREVRSSLAALNELASERPDDYRIGWYLGRCEMRLARAHLDRGEFDPAAAAVARARSRLESATVGGDHAVRTDLAEALALTYEVDTRRLQRAIDTEPRSDAVIEPLLRAIAIGRELVQQRHDDSDLIQLATFLQSLAAETARRREFDDAGALLDEAGELIDRVTAERQGTEFVLLRRGTLADLRGRFATFGGDHEKAAPSFDRAFSAYDRLVTGNPDNREYCQHAAEVGLLAGSSHRQLGEFEAAAATFRRGQVHARELAAAMPDDARAKKHVGVYATFLLDCLDHGVEARAGERATLTAEQDVLEDPEAGR